MYAIYLILGVLAVWLFLLSFFLYRTLKFFNSLAKGAKGEGLKIILEKVISGQSKNLTDITLIKKEIERIEGAGLGYIQKVGLLRFNPFDEIGGDNSFSLVVLDGKDNGFVMTGLHTRERTRIYLKSIRQGRSDRELSSEEKKAYLKAKKDGENK